MSSERKRDVVKTALLAMWGMATLVLVFSLALLVYEMIRKGQNPLDLDIGGLPVATSSTGTELRGGVPSTMREVVLYFANPEGTELAPERRKIAYSPEFTVENCRASLDALIAGPETGLAPLVSADTRVRGIYLLDGNELVIDFSRELELTQPKSAAAEFLMVRGIVATLTQSGLQGRQESAVRRIRFLFEGAPQDSFPAHIDLSEPVTLDAEWLQARTGVADNG